MKRNYEIKNKTDETKFMIMARLGMARLGMARHGKVFLKQTTR